MVLELVDLLKIARFHVMIEIHHISRRAKFFSCDIKKEHKGLEIFRFELVKACCFVSHGKNRVRVVLAT